MIQSPKSRFLAEERLAKQFLDVVDSESFQRATELAMLALLDDDTVEDAAARFHRIEGARAFLEILKSLPEQPKPMASRQSHNLQHDLK